MPILPADDPAFKQRCIILDFLATFVDNPNFEERVTDCMGGVYQAQYRKDISTEKWIVDGPGKQVFFNLLTQVFTKVPEMPVNVRKFTLQQFDKQDSLL